MSPDLQCEALAVLAQLCALSPDVRLGQLLAHLGFLGEAHVGKGLGYIEDDEFLAILYRHRTELLARTEGPSSPAMQAPPTGLSVSGSAMQPATATEPKR